MHDVAAILTLLKKARDPALRASHLLALGAHAHRHGLGSLAKSWQVLELGRRTDEAALRPGFGVAFAPGERADLARDVARRAYGVVNEGVAKRSPRSGFVLRLMDDAIASGAPAPDDVEAIRANLAATDLQSPA